MSRVQCFLTNAEREQARERYIKAGAIVRREGDRSLVLVRTAWIDERRGKPQPNHRLTY